MNLKNQRRIAASLMGVGVNRVMIKPEVKEDVSEAITREDIRVLIHKGKISKKREKGVSRGRCREREKQKRKGRRKGHGKRSGTKKARTPDKRKWMVKVRALRDELQKMKEKEEIDTPTYRKLYRQIKGNLFKSRRHLREHVGVKGSG